jgi:hypothetical protein
MTLPLKINEQIVFPLDRPQLLLDSVYTFVYYVCPADKRFPTTIGRCGQFSSSLLQCGVACRHPPGQPLFLAGFK